MIKFVNIAGQYSDTIGSGDLTLTIAVPGYVTFEQAGISNGDIVGYVIWDHFGPSGPESREVGHGTYMNDVLSRGTVLMSTESSNGYVDCSGSQQVYVTATAEDIQTAFVSDIPPSNPYNGQLWWDVNTGDLFLYYKDKDSDSQWVSCINTPNTGIFPDQGGNSGKFLKVKNGEITW